LKSSGRCSAGRRPPELGPGTSSRAGGGGAILAAEAIVRVHGARYEPAHARWRSGTMELIPELNRRGRGRPRRSSSRFSYRCSPRRAATTASALARHGRSAATAASALARHGRSAAETDASGFTHHGRSSAVPDAVALARHGRTSTALAAASSSTVSSPSLLSLSLLQRNSVLVQLQQQFTSSVRGQLDGVLM
jgi:hypothetical protein